MDLECDLVVVALCVAVRVVARFLEDVVDGELRDRGVERDLGLVEQRRVAGRGVQSREAGRDDALVVGPGCLRTRMSATVGRRGRGRAWPLFWQFPFNPSFHKPAELRIPEFCTVSSSDRATIYDGRRGRTPGPSVVRVLEVLLAAGAQVSRGGREEEELVRDGVLVVPRRGPPDCE